MTTPGVTEAVAARTRRQVLAEEKAAHNHPAYAKLSYLMGLGIQESGRDSHVIDDTGRPFLAMFDQYGNQSFGYSNPRVIAAIQDKLATLDINSSKVMIEEDMVALATRLSELTGHRIPYAYFANGGGESIDNALKLARAHTGRPKFVTAEGCFHGKTFGALSASGRADHRELFQPLLEEFQQVPFGDLDAMAAAVDDRTAAVLLEPVQAEAGVFVPTAEYLQGVRRICDERGAALIFDEMQTAFGRCGAFFAHQIFETVPDLMCVGKAFGGGVVAISAVMGKAEFWRPLDEAPSTFGSSLGGNPLSCRVGLEVVAMASEVDFIAGVREKGALIDARLTELCGRFPDLVRGHRGIGMMHGVELESVALSGLMLKLLIERGVSSTFCLYNTAVLRVQPPMTMSVADLERGLAAVHDAFAEIESRRPPRCESMPDGRWTVREVVAVDADPDAVLAVMRERPRCLDPFAFDPGEAAPPVTAEEFAGTLGDDVVVWSDVLTVADNGVVATAAPGWVWRSLERVAVVRSCAGGGAEIEVRITWHAGVGLYEDFVGGPIEFSVRRRLAGLVADLVDRVGQESASRADQGRGTGR
jgi:putrescine aminotransferase